MTDRIRAALIELEAAIDAYVDGDDDRFDAWLKYAEQWDLPTTVSDWIEAH